MANSSCPVNAAGPTLHKRSRGRSRSGCSESRSGMPGKLARLKGIDGTGKKRRGSEPRAVALLELLAAAAGTWVVAADAGVRVGNDAGSNRRRLGGDGRIATHEPINRRLARDHGRGPAG